MEFELLRALQDRGTLNNKREELEPYGYFDRETLKLNGTR